MTDKDPVVEEDEQRLQQLDEEISQARQHFEQQTHEHERAFVDDGSEDKGETDDTIAPG